MKDGKGVGIDEKESFQYIKMSADKGYSKAIEYLKKISFINLFHNNNIFLKLIKLLFSLT